MKTATLNRVFNYNGMQIPDPNPTLSDEQAIKALSVQYPELTNAKVEPAKIEGTNRILGVHIAAGTKG